MDAMLVVDMQTGLLNDAASAVERLSVQNDPRRTIIC
jgi:hypothetical protein